MDQVPPRATPAQSHSASNRSSSQVIEEPEKKSELRAFLFLTVVMAPALAGAIVATYGLAVWIYQMIAGPPTG
jgi:periplasmic nitrate reductase NapE